jgi:hypothetical protein
MKNSLIFAATLLVSSLASTAHANSITWNLVGSSSQLLGVTDKVVSTTGNVTMMFAGFVTNTGDVATSNSWSASTAQASALFAKNGGGDETGLGIAADPTGDNEIFKNSFIQIDINGLLAQKSITALQLMIGSVQSGEGFNIWGSNTANQPGTLLLSGTSTMDDVLFNVPSYGNYRYVSVSSSANNVLLDTVTAVMGTSTPEPGTLSLGFIAALFAAAWLLWKKPLGLLRRRLQD